MPLPLDRSSLLRELIQIGIGLTSERDLALLPARILTAARRFTHAEAGSLYLRDGDRLRFVVVQNDVLARRLGEREMQRLFESHLPLSAQSLAGYVALSGDVLRVSDVYEIPTDRPYVFNRAVDAETGYRTRSVLVVPLKELRDWRGKRADAGRKQMTAFHVMPSCKSVVLVCSNASLIGSATAVGAGRRYAYFQPYCPPD